MGYKELSLKLPTDYDDSTLKNLIKEELSLSGPNFSFRLVGKSLDARKKSDIHWLLRVIVRSEEIDGGGELFHDEFGGWSAPESETAGRRDIFDAALLREMVGINERKRAQKILIAGSGPAGFFAAFVLQMAGFRTVLIERGSEVKKRAEAIREFEKSGRFNPKANYAFGEGGAGTFSDGKLTSRSKHISREKRFILASYVCAGAPEEIMYMTHPHLGSDNLRQIVRRLRNFYIQLGGEILFETMLSDISVDGRSVKSASCTSDYESVSSGIKRYEIGFDDIIIAPGHSAYETYRMLMARGVRFKSKPFALGCRVEHPQELINIAQWGKRSLPGVKAAEYRLTSKGDGNLPVYTFCMCPGGVIVQSTAYEGANTVNGMSRYRRNGKYANAACVAGINLSRLLGRDVSAGEALEWLETLERRFYTFSDGYAAPFCTVESFINAGKLKGSSSFSRGKPGIDSLAGTPESSYALGLKSAKLWEMLPDEVSSAIRAGLKDFGRKLKGYESGLIMGLESKTSAPVAALREDGGLCTGFDNIYIAGEGSGYAGGIVSSASDGIRAARSIIDKYKN